MCRPRLPPATPRFACRPAPLAPHLRLLAGVSNIGDKTYYSRVFQNAIEPALGRTYCGGFAYQF